jgi:hypothetical protein
MRNPPGDGADQRSTRRRDQVPGRDRRPEHPPAAASVFAPGYDVSRPEPADGAAAGSRVSSPGTAWYGSAAGGAAGKGPVRGYPPVPGQPPPMYPPGQFAAWNRPRAGETGANAPGLAPGLSARGEAARASGPHARPGAPAVVPPGLDRPDPGYPGSPGSADQIGQRYRGSTGSGAPGAGSADSQPYMRPSRQGAAPDNPSGSRYYAQEPGSGPQPGYPMLAVSDPAADVTSTQTWQAVGDGRATGVWTAPARRDDQVRSASRAGADASDTAAIPRRTAALDSPGSDPATFGAPALGTPALGTPALGTPALGTPALGTAALATAGRDSGSHLRDPATRPGDADGDGLGRAEPDRRSARSRSGAHTSPHQIPRSQRRAGPSARPDASTRPAGQKPRSKRPASVRLAIATAVVLVIGAGAALSYAVLHKSNSPKASDKAANKPAASVSVSPSPSPSLGPYGHIASRKADPAPLTMSELYPATFTAAGTSVVRTADSKGTNCDAELVGSRIQSAIGSAGCDQVVRATYLASAQGVMGTIGVLNLSTAKAATTVARAADASDFISQLAGKHGATTKIGQGTGIEEAAAKGHYLILIWAEFTNLRKPRTTAQLNAVEQFMTELLKNTANVSLTNRMLAGTP